MGRREIVGIETCQNQGRLKDMRELEGSMDGVRNTDTPTSTVRWQSMETTRGLTRGSGESTRRA
jgi:hypothetical protein